MSVCKRRTVLTDMTGSEQAADEACAVTWILANCIINTGEIIVSELSGCAEIIHCKRQSASECAICTFI